VNDEQIPLESDGALWHRQFRTVAECHREYYTLTGLRVAADTKGLLITGGKKIIIK